MGSQAELAHLFRALKAPAAARALPKLADRARQEEWSYERFIEALLQTEVSARDSHGGEARIRQARFPARKTLEEFDFTFQRSVRKTVIEHLGQLDFLHAKECLVALGPPGTGKDTAGDRIGHPCLSGWPPRPVRDRDRMGRPASRRQARRPARGRARHARPDLAPDRRSKPTPQLGRHAGGELVKNLAMTVFLLFRVRQLSA
jgi:IstB-like ATP binding protein